MTQAIGFQQQIPQKVILMAQTGDLLALESIYRTYADACYSLSIRLCHNPMLAQDVVQEVFIKVMQRIGSYRNQGSFAGWIRKIVAHETINRIKSESRLQLVTDDEICNIESNDLFDLDWFSACRDLDTVLNQLSVTARAVLWLHEVEGYNHKEIAQLYDKSESFSKVTLSRAYASLKDIVLKQEQKKCI